MHLDWERKDVAKMFVMDVEMVTMVFAKMFVKDLEREKKVVELKMDESQSP
jgi:hypothetical protein